jgi:hypothetical protein
LGGVVLFFFWQAVFSFLFGDDQFMRRYHKVVNEDPDAEISSWTADGKRTVRFTAPLNAPALVRRFIGKLKVSREGGALLISKNVRVGGGQLHQLQTLNLINYFLCVCVCVCVCLSLSLSQVLMF